MYYWSPHNWNNIRSPLQYTNLSLTMLCMNIYLWKTLWIYKNILVNVIINISIKQFLEYPWYPILRDSLTTVNCHISHMYLEKSSARKSLLDVKHKTSVHRLVTTKLKHNEIGSVSVLCYSNPDRLKHTKTNEPENKSL